jgi:hypothetical protein
MSAMDIFSRFARIVDNNASASQTAAMVNISNIGASKNKNSAGRRNYIINEPRLNLPAGVISHNGGFGELHHHLRTYYRYSIFRQ